MPRLLVFRPDVQDAPLPAAALTPRRVPFDGFRITLINNGKPKTLPLLTGIAEDLALRFSVKSVAVHSKPSAGSPITDDSAAEIASRSDLVITGLGDCGACSSCSLVDAILMERRGIPAAVVITEPFTDVCDRVSYRMGYPGYPPIVIPHPAASRSDEWIRKKATECADSLEAMFMAAVNGTSAIP